MAFTYNRRSNLFSPLSFFSFDVHKCLDFSAVAHLCPCRNGLVRAWMSLVLLCIGPMVVVKSKPQRYLCWSNFSRVDLGFGKVTILFNIFFLKLHLKQM